MITTPLQDQIKQALERQRDANAETNLRNTAESDGGFFAKSEIKNYVRYRGFKAGADSLIPLVLELANALEGFSKYCIKPECTCFACAALDNLKKTIGVE